ncbi:alpha/beta hydrolase [Microbacterium phosphatis]|uniref:alpha/beta hydrolase n=1 Tax=Microbacterium phosphatis TaxID=3140248 RepID=UPI0031409DD2
MTLSLDPDAVLWSGEPDGRPLLVLLHGYGADEHDLFALVPHLPAEFAIAAVRAPLAPPFPTPGRSWYPIEGLEARDAAPTTLAAEAVLAWIADVAGDAPVGLLGFSQGGAVALQMLRLDPARISFVVNLSGYASPGELPRDAELAELRPPVFWGRGALDEVIPEALVLHTTDWLPAHSDLVGRIYPALRHAVSELELEDVRVFLDKRLGQLRG